MIGTTRSHQKEKNGLICERFRLIIPVSNQINDRQSYSSLMSQAIKHYGSDEACSDLGRFYFPCTEIISIQEMGMSFEDMAAGFPAVTPIENHIHVTQTNSDGHQGYPTGPFKVPPPWVLAALRTGVPKGSRHRACLRIAVALSARGFLEDEIFAIVSLSPFGSEVDISDKELHRTISNGIKWLQSQQDPHKYSAFEGPN